MRTVFAAFNFMRAELAAADKNDIDRHMGLAKALAQAYQSPIGKELAAIELATIANAHVHRIGAGVWM